MLRPEDYFDLTGYRHAALFHGVERVWDALGRIDAYLAGLAPGAHPDAPDAAVDWARVVCGADVVIEPFAVVHGPAVLGDGCVIRSGAYVRSGVVLGRGCVIRGEVKHAILLDGAAVPHFSYVGDSVLGHDVNMGAGSQILNLERRGGAIHVRVNGEKVATGLRKLGAILGDGCYVGGNATLNPGVLLGPGSFVHPGVVVRKGVYPPATTLA